MQKPSSFGTGVSGVAGAAGQTVATGAFSVATSFRNEFGDRRVAVTVRSDRVYTLNVYGAQNPFASTGTGPAAGTLLATFVGRVANGTAATGPDGETLYVTIAGFAQVLPVIVQSSGTSAIVTVSYQTFND